MEHKIQVWRISFVAISILCIFLSTGNQVFSAEVKLKAGIGYSLVFKANGDVYGWGWGQLPEPYAQLSKLDKVELATPTKMERMKDFIDIFFVDYSTIIALKKDGTVWLWSGGLDDSSDTENVENKGYPRQIKKLKKVTAIAQGDHILFLNQDGNVWEYGYYGEDDCDICSPSFRQVPGLKDIQTIAAGIGHYLVLKKDGTVWVWGKNDFGQLGDTPGAYRNRPVQIKFLKDIICIAAGDNHSLALKADGTVWAWGKNDFGQLGCGTKKSLKGIQKVKITQGVVSVAAGGNYNTALKSDGTVWIWGKHEYSRKGKETDKEELAPVQISGLTKIKKVTTSADHSLALKEDGSLWAWGDNCNGQVGNGTKCKYRFPVKVKDLKNVVAVSASAYAYIYNKSYALTSDGKVWVWGQTGNDPKDYYNIPMEVTGLKDITKISAGTHYNIFLKSDKTVWVWGYEDNIKKIPGGLPLQVKGLNDIIGITRSNLALKSDGTVWYWKCREAGWVGFTEPAEPKTMERVAHLSNVTSIISNGFYNFALKADGTVWSWEAFESDKSISKNIKNSDSNTSKKEIITPGAIPVRKAPVVHPRDIIPRQIPNLANVISIEIGQGYCLALKSDGTVWYWHLYPHKIYRTIYNSDGSLSYEKIFEEAPGWDVPKKLSDLVDIIAISVDPVGDERGLALKADGTVWGWKSWKEYKDNYRESTTYITEPIQVYNLTDVVAITATHSDYSLALKKDGKVWAWGENESGQLGTGGNIHQYIPIQVSGEDRIGYFFVN